MMDVNWGAVIVGAIWPMVLGFVWYSKPVFATPWMELAGLKESDIKNGPGAGYAWTFVGALIAAYTMSLMVGYAGATTAGEGAMLGAWIGVGFVATAMLADSIFGKKPMKLWLIQAGYQVVNLIGMGAILAVWR